MDPVLDPVREFEGVRPDTMARCYALECREKAAWRNASEAQHLAIEGRKSMASLRTITFAALMSVASPAAAQNFPTWKIADICAKESAPGQCEIFEAEAQRSLSGSWTFVLDAARKSCLGRAAAPADHSYRLLADCIDEELKRAVDKRAVLTAATPAEPVPPPKPRTEAPADVPGMPAPLFGVPTEPPKSQ
jgi:hypothetical protein